MKFSELDLMWKIFVVIGFISTLLLIFTILFVVLMFETDIVQLGSKEPNLDEFDYLFDNKPKE